MKQPINQPPPTRRPRQQRLNFSESRRIINIIETLTIIIEAETKLRLQFLKLLLLILASDILLIRLLLNVVDVSNEFGQAGVVVKSLEQPSSRRTIIMPRKKNKPS